MCRSLSMIFFVLFGVCFAGNVRVLPKPALDGRIVGGDETTIEKYPYQLSLLKSGAHFCGAAIIGDVWLLTAAHCALAGNVRIFSVRAGSTTQHSGGTIHKISTIHVHEKYDSFRHDYDIALMKVEKPFALGTPGVNRINLPNQGDVPPVGSEAVITGWGRISSNGIEPEYLQKVNVFTIDDQKCSDIYTLYGGITKRMICAYDIGKDSCQGDSGGPLAAGDTLIGIISWGYGCALPDWPGVYTRVSEVRDWIKDNTGI